MLNVNQTTFSTNQSHRHNFPFLVMTHTVSLSLSVSHTPQHGCYEGSIIFCVCRKGKIVIPAIRHVQNICKEIQISAAEHSLFCLQELSVLTKNRRLIGHVSLHIHSQGKSHRHLRSVVRVLMWPFIKCGCTKVKSRVISASFSTYLRVTLSCAGWQ